MFNFLLVIFSFFSLIFSNNYNFSSENYKINSKYLLGDFRLERKTFVFKDEISAQGIIVREFSGKILYEKNKDQIFPIASLTKLLTIYLSFQIYEPNTIFTFSQKSIEQYGQVGDFKYGEKIKFEDLLKVALVASSNQVAYLLAENYGYENFLKKVNEILKEWNLKNTRIVEPTGISSQNVSTPFELTEIAFRIFSNTPEIFQITKEESIFVNGKYFWNTNLLLNKYKDIIIGGKTGFTDEAGECLLLLVKFKNSPYLTIVLLNSKDRFKDAEKIIQALKNYYEQ